MNKRIGNLIALTLGLLLLVYSASRSLHFIEMTLPPDRKILAWFGLAALDGGLVAWLITYLHGSSGGWQRAISIIMVIIDLLGSILLFSADTLLSAGTAGLIATLSETDIRNVILAMSAIIAINIMATVAHELTDPETMKAQAEEEARGEIEDLALAMIRQNAKQVAATIAPQIAGHWRDETSAEYKNKLGKKAQLPALPADVTEQSTDVNPTPRRRSKAG